MQFGGFCDRVRDGLSEDKPDLIILSLTTANGRKDYAITKEQN